MDNNQQPTPRFDPETGRPLNPQPAQSEQPAPRFDPETGRPLDPPPAQPAQAEQPAPRFDPETGRPLNPQPQPQQPQPRFDPETGRPLDPPPARPEQPAVQPQRLDTPPYIPPTPGQNYTGGTFNAAPPQPAKTTNGYAVGALICGILSLVCCCCCGGASLLGIVAIVLAVLSKRGSEKMPGMAVAGLICGILTNVFSLIATIIYVVEFVAYGGFEGFMDMIANEFGLYF